MLRHDAQVWFIGREGKWYVPAVPGTFNATVSTEDSLGVDNLNVLPGTSGAPLIGAGGIVGMIVLDAPGQISYALPIDLIKGAFERWNHPWQLVAMKEPVPAPSPNRTVQYPMTLSAGGEARAGNAVYKILAARLDRYPNKEGGRPNKLALQLSIRAIGVEFGWVHITFDFFRLIVDGSKISPEDFHGASLLLDSHDFRNIVFVIPASASNIVLQVGDPKAETATIPIELKPVKP